MSEIKINNTKISEQTALEQKRNINVRDDSNTDKSQTTDNGARPNTVSLTDTATQIQSLQKAISDSSEIDQSRVEALRTAIADGSYKVNATELAQNIINFEQRFK
ncbi:MAG: flagellar biosynthesis anti-sigma factor FlgM [Gammaproteobacteria bacterium]|nr:MAG: flagellar biosynthesis anti-sigma factor FlgM [Gammaproteobacteria bacterium]RKZ95868.1 MAG: flagellar biosynthesis anti-sigma factor FlgM [Gammaproteobacteria bacterium]RKZ96578.1 MAG: flagellar biosynthesis anti-sigma factor FlgM [Gammaproteobacteria bacterium]